MESRMDKVVTITWQWLNSPHHCQMEELSTGHSQGTLSLPWDDDHYIDIGLRCVNGKWMIEGDECQIVADADNQIVGHVDSGVVRFAGDVPHGGQWGGARDGAGRPADEWPRQLIRIAASDEEKALILSSTTPRKRAEALLRLAQEANDEA